MTKQIFVELLEEYKKILSRTSLYAKFGIDLVEVEHSPITPADKIMDLIFESLYTEEGVDWINWFMWENSFGENGLEATDCGKLICQTSEDLYDYIEQYRNGTN